MTYTSLPYDYLVYDANGKVRDRDILPNPQRERDI